MRSNDDEDEIGQKLANITAGNLQSAVMELHRRTGKPSKSSAVALMLNGCVAAVNSLALLVGGCPDCDETGHHSGKPDRDEMLDVGRQHINPTSLLFSAILVNKICPEGPDPSGGIQCEISPTVIADALDTTERLLGKRPDEYLDPFMCKQVRECIEEGGVPLAKLLESRKASPSKTLN